MDLEDRIRDVELLTEALQAALAAGDDAACARLGDERGTALAALVEAAARDQAGVARLRERLQALRLADQELRTTAETLLAETGAALHASRAHGVRRPALADPSPGSSSLNRLA